MMMFTHNRKKVLLSANTFFGHHRDYCYKKYCYNNNNNINFITTASTISKRKWTNNNRISCRGHTTTTTTKDVTNAVRKTPTKSSRTIFSTSGGGGSSLFGILTILSTWYAKKLDTNPIITKSITSGIVSGTGDIICQYLQQIHEQQQQQQQQNKNKNNKNEIILVSFDYIRTCRFVLLGTIFVGPICHYWYQLLSTKLIIGPPTIQTVLKRVFYDQILFAPCFLSLWVVSFWTLQDIIIQQPKIIITTTDIIYPLTHQQQHEPNNNIINNSNNTILVQQDQQQQQQQQIGREIYTFNDKIKQYPFKLYNELPDMLIVNWMLWIPAMFINFKFMPLKYQVLFSNMIAVTWNIFISYYTSTPTATTNTTTTSPTNNNNEEEASRKKDTLL